MSFSLLKERKEGWRDFRGRILQSQGKNDVSSSDGKKGFVLEVI